MHIACPTRPLPVAFRPRRLHGALAAALLWTAGATLAPACADDSAGRFRLPPAPQEASPAGVGVAAPVTLARVRVVGAHAVPTAELEALAAPWLQRPLRALDLEELRQRITRVYVERGYINSGALLDDGALQGDTLTLRVVEGRLTHMRQRGLQGLSESYLAARLLQGDEILDLRQLQERVELQLADPLFAQIQARLLPGEALGQAVLDLEVTRARPWQLALFANNHLAPAVGAAQAGVEAGVRNLLGVGDALAGTLARSEGSTNVDALWQLPLWGTRTQLALHLARGSSSVIEEPVAALDIGSVVSTREATLSHPFVDLPRRRWLLGLTYSARRNRTTLAGEPFSFVTGEDTGQTRVQSWRLFQELTLRIDRDVLALRAAFAQGRNNLAAASVLPGLAPRRYRLWQLQGQALLAYGNGGQQLLLRGQVQHSMDPLVGLEQMALGGRYTVRGYRENQLVRDNGFALSAQWQQPLWHDEARRFSLTLTPFLDAGQAWNRGEGRARLAAIGLGLNWTLADLEGEVQFARRLERRPTATHGNLQDHGIHLMLRWRPSL